MPFEFDPSKSASNKDKHGIDFDEAQALWEDDKRIENDTSFDREARYLTTGRIGEHFWTAVFTMREGRVRLISVRRARNEEIQRYQDDHH
jgi:uncharacterized DUF497 family protein